MPRAQVPFYSLNAGEVDPDALARIDLEKLRVAGESVVNFTPTVLGGLHMRPGTRFIGETKNNGQTILLPYIFNASTTSLIEISASAIRVRNNDALVTFAEYATTITNSSFDSSIGTGWTNASTIGASVAIASGDLSLYSTKYSYARARQQVNVSSANVTTLHTLKIVVARGPVTFRIGTSAGESNVLSNQVIDNGTHYISFTPGANTIFLELEANAETQGVRIVSECSFVKNQIMELPPVWAAADLYNIRHAQSGSVIFIACKGYKPYMLERRGANSWGLVEYKTSGGPYIPYTGSKVRIKASGSVGNVTLTSDQPFFKSGMVGAVFELTNEGQRRTEIFTGLNQATEAIRVTGVGGKIGDARKYTYTATYEAGSSGTLRVYFSYGQQDAWVKGYGEQVTASVSGSGTFNVNDAVLRAVNNNNDVVESNDNSIVYHRILRESGTGKITVVVNYSGGAQTGVVRITGFTNSTTVSAEVLSELGAVDQFTDDWREGAWSDNQSWPSAVTFHDGRLWWGGLDKVYGSVSDDYFNYDPTVEGDSGPIVRSIATGPVENINWMLGLQRLIVGTASAEVSIRSSSFDEPLTPSQFTARNASTMGCAPLQAVTLDSIAIYAQKNLFKIYEFLYDINVNDYTSRDLTRLNKYICKPGVVDMAVQRQPDTRIWFVKSDGTMAMLVYERSDDVVGWSRFETDGTIESVCVLPSSTDDNVYVVVNRTIQGQTKRYVEKLGVSSITEDGNGSWLVDSAVQFSTGGVSTKTITGLGHLAGKQVIALGGSSDPTKLYTVTATGQITVDNFVTSIVVGLPYTARFKSVKLAYGSANGTALGQKKRVDHLGIVANNTAPDGVSIGRDFSNMTKLSSLLRGKQLTAGEIVSHYDYDATSFGGAWDTDSRVCFKCQSPYPAHIIGLIVKMNTNDKVFAWQRRQEGPAADEA